MYRFIRYNSQMVGQWSNHIIHCIFPYSIFLCVSFFYFFNKFTLVYRQVTRKPVFITHNNIHYVITMHTNWEENVQFFPMPKAAKKVDYSIFERASERERGIRSEQKIRRAANERTYTEIIALQDI